MGKKEIGDSKIIQKNGKNKQKMEKVKKAVKAGLIETPEPVLAEFDEMPVNNKGSKKSKSDKKVLEEPIESDEGAEVESDEGDEVESDEGDEVESDEGDEAESAEDEVQNESDEEETQNESDEAPDEIKIHREEDEADEDQGYTLFVENLSYKTTKEEIINLFNSYGKVLSVIFLSSKGITYNPIPKSPFKAFVVLDSVKAACKALKVNGTLVNGKEVKVKKRENRKAFVLDSTKTIFVGNINQNTFSPDKENKLKIFFSSCGSVKFVKLCNTYGFVCFNDPKSIQSALNLNGSVFDDRPIKVRRYEEKSEFIPTDMKALENLSPEELKEKMVELGQKYSKLQKSKSSAPYNKFNGVRSKPSAPYNNFKGVRGQKIFKAPRKFVRKEN